MAEINLVTAFFDIGRGNWGHAARGTDKYLNYFKHWAQINNKLVIYADQNTGEKALEIRQQFGLLDKTRLIVIDDVRNCDSELYEAIKSTMKNKYSWYFHHRLQVPESWNYNFNYVVTLKPYFVSDAIKRGLVSGNIAWIDFGFDHGGENYPNSNDFNLTWDNDFDYAIYVATYRKLDNRPIVNVVNTGSSYFRGGIIIAPSALWGNLWDLWRESAMQMSACGLADDDQTVMLMAYRKHPELFHLCHWSEWGEMFWQFLREPEKSKVFFRRTKGINQNSKGKYYKRKLAKWLTKWDIKKRHGAEIEKQYYSEEDIYWNNHKIY